MFLNQFSVRIPEGVEKPGGYVELAHNTPYTIVMRNARNVRAAAEVVIDGKPVGKFRLYPNQPLRLERPSHIDGRFTFLVAGTPEAHQAGAEGVSHSDRGLIKVTFTPEKEPRPIWVSYVSQEIVPDTLGLQDQEDTTAGGPITRSAVMTCSASMPSRKAGITGLTGKSGQSFRKVPDLDYDYSQQTVIHLRLVEAEGAVRPLTSYSTPVPPAV